jgi:hypothetical protein
MPTNRKPIRRPPKEPLSAFQIAYLLDQEELPPPTDDDRWWLICAATQTNPGKAWFFGDGGNCCSAIVLWQRYRKELLPRWRELHGRRKHPLERGEQPQVARLALHALSSR